MPKDSIEDTLQSSFLDDSITRAAKLLGDESLPAKKVQRLFDEWWPKRSDAEAKLDADRVLLTVESKECNTLITDQPQSFHSGELGFPRQKLSENQLAKATSEEEVQKFFDEWWPKRSGKVKITDDKVVLTVKVEYFGGFGIRLSSTRERFYPRKKLSKAQLEQLAMSYVMWAAGRATAIALVPLPLADVGPLMANEAYMIYRIAEVYGYTADKSTVSMLAGMAGGSLVGKVFASFLPFLKVAIAPSVTYAVGKAAMAYFTSGMTLSEEALKEKVDAAGEEAKKINWEELKIESSENQEESPDNSDDSSAYHP